MRKRSSRKLGSAGLGVALALTCGAALAQSGTGAPSGANRPGVPPPHGLTSAAPSAGTNTSDTLITARAKAALAGTDGLESNDVHVTTDRATVTLTGTVANAAQRDRAGSVVQHLDGVTSVTNLLQVGMPSH